MLNFPKGETFQRIVDRKEAFLRLVFSVSYDLTHVKVGLLNKDLRHITYETLPILNVLERSS